MGIGIGLPSWRRRRRRCASSKAQPCGNAGGVPWPRAKMRWRHCCSVKPSTPCACAPAASHARKSRRRLYLLAGELALTCWRRACRRGSRWGSRRCRPGTLPGSTRGARAAGAGRTRSPTLTAAGRSRRASRHSASAGATCCRARRRAATCVAAAHAGRGTCCQGQGNHATDENALNRFHDHLRRGYLGSLWLGRQACHVG